MSLPAQTYTVPPIGFVCSAIDKPADDCWAGLLSVIELDPERFTAESTLGLSESSRVEIVVLFDSVAPEKAFTRSRHPRDREDWPKTAIFARRAKDRPNRIRVNTRQIESIDGLRISVRELDAINGTPALGIKPYVAEFGPREPVRQTAWSCELMASYFKPAK
jgi:tRNA (Thr-GGU) A37 N-methylase